MDTLESSAFDLETARGRVASGNDIGGDPVASTHFVAEQSENHYVRVYGYLTGTYTLRMTPAEVKDDHTNLPNHDATPIDAGDRQPGKLDYHGDTDVFWLKVEEGKTYQFDARSETLDTILKLYGALGDLLSENDDHESQRFSRIVWTADSVDIYYIAVGGYNTGPYTLTVEEVE